MGTRAFVHRVIRLLGISGSLRAVSSNTELLRALARLAPPEIEVTLEPDVGAMPGFNPDVQGAEPPPVVNFRERLRRADAVVISSPEYAHGVSGVLKNALDWVVGSGEFSGKPVAIINASPRATLAHASLVEIITTMDAKVVAAACLSFPLLGRKLDAAAISADPALSADLRIVLAQLVSAVATRASV